MAKVLQDSNTIKSCPVCNRSGHTTNGNGVLILRQINATEAIYVCNNTECFYPVGEEVAIIKRTVPELLYGGDREGANGGETMPAPADLEGGSGTVQSVDLNPEGNSHQAESSDLPRSQMDTLYDSLVDPQVCDWFDSQSDLPMSQVDPPEGWFDSLVDPEVCNWLDSQTSS